MSLMKSQIIDSVLVVEFRDPSTRNSFSLRAAEELHAILQKERGNFTGFIFSAQGRVFCSGGNLADYSALSEAEHGKEINRQIAKILDELSCLPVPTVCLVRGDCFGGGLELISAFDVVLSAPSVLFGFWQRKIGLTYGWGGGARLERRLGEHRVRQLALRAMTFGALEARRMGLIDGIYLEHLLFNEAMAMVRAMARLPKGPVGPVKSLTPVNERETFEKLWWSDEHRAVLNRFRS